MDKDLIMEYVEWFIGQTDDGTFGTEDDLAWFVLDALYEEFGDGIGDVVDRALEKRHMEGDCNGKKNR